ncbi:hypothetical protein GCM10023208_21020 [Erythrobacter westpacificensis]|uniref:Uncharacterized protein n=1 Tax=Erythrobacter westpacificensis TaxID=1055231 RepID=A0ABP9KGH6_9SPHN
MPTEYCAQHRHLSLSECERLCTKHSRDVEILANLSGLCVLPNQSLSVPIGNAINMLVLSISRDAGAEPRSMSAYLPGLRNEALLHLGEEIDNWSWNGPDADRQTFFNRFYGQSDAVRAHIAPLLRCCRNTATRRLLFYSQSDVKCLTNDQIWSAQDRRTPIFTIDAHDLAQRVRAVCNGALFTAKTREPAF